jgi:hypothetical protein
MSAIHAATALEAGPAHSRRREVASLLALVLSA